MTRPQRTITTLLAVVAVLLAVNIAVSLNRQAGAQPQVQIAPHVTGLAQNGSYILRGWSDGVVEFRRYTDCGGVPALRYTAPGVNPLLVAGPGGRAP